MSTYSWDGLCTRLGTRLLSPLPLRGLSDTQYHRANLIFCVMALVVVPVLAIGMAQNLTVIITGTGVDIDPPHIIGGWTLVIVGFLLPRAAFRTSQHRATRRLLSAPRNNIVSISRSVVVFSPILVATLLGSAYIYHYWVLTSAIALMAVVETIVVARRRRNEDQPSSLFDMLLHVFLSIVFVSTAYVTTTSLSSAWTAAVYTVDQPLTDPEWTIPTLGLLLLFSLGALLAAVATVTVKSLIYSAIGQKYRSSSLRDILDPWRVIVAGVIGLVAWASAVISEFAGVGEDTFGMALTLVAWLSGWLLLWGFSYVEWNLSSGRIFAQWETEQMKTLDSLSGRAVSPASAQSLGLHQSARLAASLFGADSVTAILYAEGALAGRRELIVVSQTDQAPEWESPRLPGISDNATLLAAVDSQETVIATITIVGHGLRCMRGMRRRKRVARFQRLFNIAVVVPRAADPQASRTASFDTLYDARTMAPSLTAFQEAAERVVADAGKRGDSVNVFVAALKVQDFDSYRHHAASNDHDGTLLTAGLSKVAASSPHLTDTLAFTAPGCNGIVWIVGQSSTTHAALDRLRGVKDTVESSSHTSDGFSVYVTVTVQTAFYRVDGLTIRELVDSVEQRLAQEEAVASGDLSHVTVPRMEDLVGASLSAEFRDAVATNSLELVAHPMTMLSNRSNTQAGVFTKLVWHHPRLGAISGHRLLSLLDQEITLRDDAAPYLIETAIRAIEHYDQQPTPMTIVFPAPTSLLSLPLAEINGLITPLATAARDTKITVSIAFASLRASNHEALTLLASRGIRVSAIANPADEYSSAVAQHVSMVFFDADRTRRRLNGDTSVMDVSAALHSNPDLRMVGVDTSGVPDKDRFVACGFDAVLHFDADHKASAVHLAPRLGRPSASTSVGMSIR